MEVNMSDEREREEHPEEQDDLVEQAKSKPGEVPNRDEDEFTGKGLKEPPVDPDLHELAADDEH
jgi:hypothetical protein